MLQSTKKQTRRNLKEPMLASNEEFEGGINDSRDYSNDAGSDQADEEFQPPLKRRSTVSKLTSDVSIDGLDQFEEFKDLFSELTKRQYVETMLQVVNMIISYDSQMCVAICMKDDTREDGVDVSYYELQAYDLKTYELLFKKEYPGTYIKMNLIEQTDDG